MHVFLGITGASGAPYAARLLQALSASGAEVGVCISDAGVQVLATELYGDIALPRDEVSARLVDGLEGVDRRRPHDYTSPYASGSAKVDGYVICPCSMATVGDHRDRRDGEPRSTAPPRSRSRRAASSCSSRARRRSRPSTSRTCCACGRPGATILFAAPGFYHAPQTIDDLVDFVVARCLDQLGIDQTLVSRWGQ